MTDTTPEAIAALLGNLRHGCSALDVDRAAATIEALQAERDAALARADAATLFREGVAAEQDAASREDGARQERAAIVAELRADAQLCDCAAHGSHECACGAWDDCKTVMVSVIADRIEAKGADHE